MFLLTLRDLQYRAVRFMIAIVGTALVFSMALIMSGLFEGFHQEPRIPIGAVGADAWVIKEGATGAFTSIAQIQSKVADDLAAAGAERADPVLIARTSVTTPTGDRDVVLFGYRLGGLGEPGPLTAGVLPSTADEIVADEKAELAVGQEMDIQGKRFRVVGLTTRRTIFGGTPLVFANIGAVQEIAFRSQPVATAIVVKGAVSDPPQGVESKTTEDTWKDALRPLEKP